MGLSQVEDGPQSGPLYYHEPTCAVCGGKLEKSEQYPDAGYLHASDSDDTHTPVFRRVTGLASYAIDRNGLEFASWLSDDNDQPVYVEMTHTDMAFALAAMIDACGLDNVRRAVDRIAQDDPNGQRAGLSAPARLLQGIDPRKAG